MADLSSQNFELSSMCFSVSSLIMLLGSKTSQANSCLITEIAFFAARNFLGFSHLNQIRVWLSFVLGFITEMYLDFQLGQQ